MSELQVLVVTNLYPPHHIGGYELGCQDVVEALRQRGHRVQVLTSRYGTARPRQEDHVFRWLPTTLTWSYARPTPGYYLRLFLLEWQSQILFTRIIKKYQPRLVYIWSPRYISLRLAMVARRLGIPTVYFVSDDWLAHWQDDPWLNLWFHRSRNRMRRGIKKTILTLARTLGMAPEQQLKPHEVHFTSHFLWQQVRASGQEISRVRVIHWGVDVTKFPFREPPWPPRHLLYVGQIVPHKGVHIALDALAILVHRYGHRELQLTLVGNHRNSDYRASLQQRIESLQLQDHVHWAGPQPRNRLAEVYRDHEILLFPSLWDEPFAITPLEAMATGLAVVGTTTGGSPELFRHEVNALVYPRLDAEACALQVRRLLMDPGLYREVCHQARKTVCTEFAFPAMVDTIEQALLHLLHHEPRQDSQRDISAFCVRGCGENRARSPFS